MEQNLSMATNGIPASESNTDKRLVGEPLCYAPFTSFKIDTNKGVRPCSSWEDNYFGNLETGDIKNILNSPAWKLLQQQMIDNEWPRGCMACKVRELYNGESLRNNFRENAGKYLKENAPAIVEIEIDSTNQCNLACVHCSSDFSSTWMPYEDLLRQDGFSEMRTRHLPQAFAHNKEVLISNIQQLNPESLKLLRFKGGEPFLNKEIKPLLRLLDGQRCLENLHLQFVTNGSVIDKEYLDILSKCKSVHLEISVDGTGALQEYIRYGKAAIERLESFISVFSQLPNVHFTPLVSVMVYNVFNLNDIALWWQKINALYPEKTRGSFQFTHSVISPKYLSVGVLSDTTRAELIARYEAMDGKAYEQVIQSLKMPWAGAYWHEKFVKFTGLMDKYRKMSISEIVPELITELKPKPGKAVIDIDELIREIDFTVDNDCATASLYLKRAFLKREKGDNEAAIEDFNKAFSLDISLYNSVPGHWLS